MLLNFYRLIYDYIVQIREKGKFNKNKEILNHLIQLVIDYLLTGDKKNDQSYFE